MGTYEYWNNGDKVLVDWPLTPHDKRLGTVHGTTTRDGRLAYLVRFQHANGGGAQEFPIPADKLRSASADRMRTHTSQA